jgi:hypothetical protein
VVQTLVDALISYSRKHLASNMGLEVDKKMQL